METPMELLMKDLQTRSLSDVMYNFPEYLQKEKQTIIDTHLDGQLQMIGHTGVGTVENEDAEYYYKTTFKQ